MSEPKTRMVRLHWLADVRGWPELIWLMRDDAGRRYFVRAANVSASNSAFWAWPEHLVATGEEDGGQPQ